MKRTRGNAVVYMGQRTTKYARGTKGNPIVIGRTNIPRALPMRPALYRKPELKGMDTLLNTGAVTDVLTSNADMVVLNLVQQGSGSWNRVGRSIRNKSIRIKGTALCSINTPSLSLGANPTGKVVSNTMRMIVVWDKQPSGTLPAFNNIFGYTEQDGNESVDLLSGMRFDNTGRFQVLLNKVLDGNAQANGGAYANDPQPYQELAYSFDHYIKLGGRETVFSGQSSPMTIADISSGALYVIFRSRLLGTIPSDAATSNFVIRDGEARLRYTD